jgi:hypothetical protein
MRRARRHLTPSTVVASLALFVALGGTGWAGQVLGHGSVGTVQLARNAVTTPKIANGAVTKSKLAPAAITAAALAKGAVGSDAVAPGSITADRLAAGVVGGIAGTKITTVISPVVSIPPANAGTAVTATCPAGQKAIGGGWVSGRDAAPDSEAPTPDGTGWTVVFETFSVSSAAVSTSAICAAP